MMYHAQNKKTKKVYTITEAEMKAYEAPDSAVKGKYTFSPIESKEKPAPAPVEAKKVEAPAESK